MHSGVFETGSRFNHSCVPNAQFKWIPFENSNTGRMLYWNKVQLFAGDEVTISYGHNRARLRRDYGFDCCCERCMGEQSKQKEEGEEEDTVMTGEDTK